jgi:hypothetical protein
MHIVWNVPRSGAPIVEASATLTIAARPAVAKLWFWALQAGFGHDGGAHLGLQWYDRFPGSTAANFGGYDRVTGAELVGPGENTRAYPWEPGHPHRLTIAADEPGSWRGSIDGVELRTLSCGGYGVGLTGLMVWTECFARCDAPPAEVRWQDFEVVTAAGVRAVIDDATLNYQTVADGGCSTGRSERVSDGWLQTTGVSRTRAR